AKAREASSRAYAPYTGFRVGAALCFPDGRILVGCNVENASLGLSMCAERNVVGAMVALRLSNPLAIAVSGAPEGGPEVLCPPCGACRQVLMEFAPELIVVLGVGDDISIHRVTDLLPLSFSLRG
ncbi:MAG: cytidine deaminase, partial [Fretibacterium sp.]|nr:cytidine deaminase [Fretibacterium sp.]